MLKLVVCRGPTVLLSVNTEYNNRMSEGVKSLLKFLIPIYRRP